MAKKVLVVLGHPASDSLCAGIAKAYAAGARQAGAELRVLALGELQFDPLLAAGCRAEQPLEPDLKQAQVDILWAEHLVWVYPVWWGAMPALLKGFIDRVFLPGFAFRYRRGSAAWDRLLAGRSAELLVTMDSPPWYYRWVTRRPGHVQMKRAILDFCGVGPVCVHSMGPVLGASDACKAGWLAQARRLGEQQGARPCERWWPLPAAWCR
jgi:putative NADPH-quinone reductase